MKKLALIIPIVAFLASCREDIYLGGFEIPKDYGVIIENGTHDEIDVTCSTIYGFNCVALKAGDKSEVLYNDSQTITLDYFGKGTYYTRKKSTHELTKGKVETVSLK